MPDGFIVVSPVGVDIVSQDSWEQKTVTHNLRKCLTKMGRAFQLILGHREPFKYGVSIFIVSLVRLKTLSWWTEAALGENALVL